MFGPEKSGNSTSANNFFIPLHRHIIFKMNDNFLII